MKARARKALTIPATLAVTVTVIAACSTPAPPTTETCEPVRVPDAGIVTYMCKDGRMCNPPQPEDIDAGVYQICPGDSDCVTIVTYEGHGMPGFC